MSQPPITLDQAAARTGNTAADKAMRDWLTSISATEKVDYLKRLWPLNFRYALQLTQGARLSKREGESLFRHWLRVGHHNSAQDLITYFVPILGEVRFWQIASQEELSPAMRESINYHSNGQLNRHCEK